MSNLTIHRLIQHLQNIENIYGNIPVRANIISQETGYVSALCVTNDTAYADNEAEQYTLLIEVEPENMFNGIPILDVYEYPSLKEINIKENK